MPSPVVHFEIRSSDPDATRSFFGKLFGWTFPDGGIPGYSYVDTGIQGAIPGGISPVQGGAPLVTFFVGVHDVAATLDAAVAQGGKIIQPAHRCPGSPSGCWLTRRDRWLDWPRPIAEASGDAAFAELVQPYQGPVFRHCYRMLGSGPDAEDATQDTLERAWRKLATYGGSGLHPRRGGRGARGQRQRGQQLAVPGP